MKNTLWISFLLALLVSGCSQEEMLRNGTSASGGRVFTTSFENDESRTYVENGVYSRWTEGDRISLFDASTLNNQYLFAGDTGDSGGTFFRLSKPEGTGTALSANYAVYPYDKDMTISADGVITLTLPSTQHYAENSYGLGDNTMVAVTENADDTFLQFKNVGGCFKFQLYGDDVTVKSITLMGNNGEKIAGKATLTAVYDKAPAVTMADDATTSITLNCGEKGVKIGATAEEATAFWVVVPPTTFEEGITITVNDMDGKVFLQTTEKELVIERNVVKPMAAIQVNPENPKIAYSENEEELEGWSAGLFGGEGTYIIGKPHGDNGYLMMVGNVLEGKGALVFMDSSRQLREIFFDNTIITFGENTDGNVDVSIMEKGCEEMIEHINLPYNNLSSRSSIDHNQKVGIANLLLNWEGMAEIAMEIVKEGGLSKKDALMFLVNKLDSIRNLVKALGGPDIFNETFSDWLGGGMNIVSLIELGQMYMKLPSTGKAVFVCGLVYTGFAITYYELYNERIEICYGNTIAEIENVTYENKSLSIKLKVSGYDNLNNLECGVIVSYPDFLGSRLWSSPVGIDTRTVTMDENYSLSVSGIDLDETYLCIPFLIREDRYSMWKGFLGEYVGPMVRYGKTVSYKTPCPSGQIISVEDRKSNSAVLKCQFSNVESGVECGIIISNDEGYNEKQAVSNTEEEQLVTISGLEPFTEYTCTPYVKLTKSEGAEYYKEGNGKTFKTLPPDISGTWTCTEKDESYSIILHSDGSASCSKYEDIVRGTWQLNNNGTLFVDLMLIATNTFNHGRCWQGTVDNMKNPRKVTGYSYNWNYNHIGYFEGGPINMVMTR